MPIWIIVPIVALLVIVLWYLLGIWGSVIAMRRIYSFDGDNADAPTWRFGSLMAILGPINLWGVLSEVPKKEVPDHETI